MTNSKLFLKLIFLFLVAPLLFSFSNLSEASHRGIYWGSWWEGTSEGGAEDDIDEEVEDYRRERDSLRRKINDLDDDRVDDVPIPILFGVSVDDLAPNFGDPRSGDRTHEGLDILAPLGAPIVSPTEAVVIRIGVGERSGKYVYTANPGGETFAYMHLDEVADNLDSGDELNAGELIGFVGNTGNASGGPAHLHFEIRDGGAMDPYFRLTKEFSIEDKIDFAADIIENISDEEEFAAFLANNYQEELAQAVSLDIELPDEIENALEDVGIVRLANTTDVASPASSDLTLGSSGPAVTALQEFLIAQNKGSAAGDLAAVGATGYFGEITRAALAEYQLSAGISPASGYFGPITQSHILSLDLTSVSQAVSEEMTPAVNDIDVSDEIISMVPQTDLALGDTGEDVVWLQRFLVSKSLGTASAELGVVGATGYFGTLTQSALAEYQSLVGITPAVGYYGAITRAYISLNE